MNDLRDLRLNDVEGIGSGLISFGSVNCNDSEKDEGELPEVIATGSNTGFGSGFSSGSGSNFGSGFGSGSGFEFGSGSGNNNAGVGSGSL